MKMKHFSTKSTEQKCGGVDVGKTFLDAAVEGGAALRRPNTPEGRADLVAFFHAHGVARVGLEASGGYEIEIRDDLGAAGLNPALVQPAQARAFARAMNLRVKTDKIDAALIAAFTSVMKTPVRQDDPRLAPLAERLTRLEQVEEDLARMRTRRDRFRDEEMIADLEEEIARLKKRQREMVADLQRRVRACADLAKRLDLLVSIPGVGLRTALSLVIRMPELGSLSREAAASLAGMAPVTRESGRWRGEAHVGGGRKRVGRAVFAAAQAACLRWHPRLVELYKRLRAAGKHHNVAVVACARKLVIYANTVLAKGQPWTAQL
jgi:transposase